MSEKNKHISLSIILAVSRLDELFTCLSAFSTQSTDGFEVIMVVDPGGKFTLNQEHYNFPALICEADSKHPSRKRNIGVSKARGDLIAFIDDDVVVSESWVGNMKELLFQYPQAIIGGPNRDARAEFKYLLAQSTQEHPLLEGLTSHKQLNLDHIEVGIHDLPLCNLAMKKISFTRIGGFNEVATYYVDDVEFHYIAKKLGIKLLQFKKLEVQHNIRPAFRNYLKYKFNTRKKIGEIYLYFPELYQDSLLIKLIFLSYIIIPLLFLLFLFKPMPLAITGLAYIFLLYATALSWRKNKIIFMIMPMYVFVTQALSYSGFTYGLLKSLLTLDNRHVVFSEKVRRYNV
ncbi:MAG: glycosyltransferase family 2 protein [Oligoflexia bacterium]|nr:glycosyltransferase family 2 protein [Oligoflexia bacterium]